MTTQQILIMLLAATAAGGLAYAFVEPYLNGDVQGEKRQKTLTKVSPTRANQAATRAGRTKQVSDTLKEVERRKEQHNKVTLADKISQAGLDWDKRKFLMVSIGCGIGAALLVFILSMNALAALGVGFVAGFGMPHWILSFLTKRRVAKFIVEFPNAMDVIVRGIKSGLPLGDCVRIIASEAAEPVRTEFRHMVESQSLGLSLPEAVAGIIKRVPTPEANFFAIVVEIQSKAGGNLSEVLGNLSRVLRERRKMRGKVQAMSMEAKASAGIIATLPFTVAILVYLSSPDYISLLWTTEAGQLSMLVSAFWMFCGVMSMKKMINFDI